MPDLLSTLDAHLAARVVVHGSLPPSGRDLDLLARPGEREALEGALAAEGFAWGSGGWARFAAGELVDLESPADWALPQAEAEDLFARAEPLAGMQHLAVPAPDHVLLVVARKTAWDPGALSRRRRERIADALARDPLAWTRAREHAGAWGAETALTALEETWRSGSVSWTTRAALLAERARRAGRGRLARRLARRRARRGTLVALSGLDGSGKSTQCARVKEALEAVGRPAVVEWTHIWANPWLDPKAKRAKAVLRRVRDRKPGPGTPAGPAGGDGALAHGRGSRAATTAWATALVLANVVWHRRATRPHLRAGRTVICDRYTLDSKVQLRYAYGDERRFRFLGRLLRGLSPKPDLALLVEVPGEVAHARNPEYPLDEAVRRARLYDEERAFFDYRAVDGTLPAQDLTDRIAREVWAR